EAPAAAPAAAAAPAGAPAAAAAPAGQTAGIVIQAAPVRVARRPGTGKVERPIAAVVRTPAPMFAGELPGEFDEILSALGAPRRHLDSGAARLGFTLLSLFQGVLGALPDGAKRRLEATVSDTRYFNAQLATAANVFLNMLIYPVVCIGLALASPQESFFAW